MSLRLLDTYALLTTKPPPTDWIVEGVAAAGTLTMLSGREKEGKSLLCEALAVNVASGGGKVAGMECKPGTALIVDAENGEPEIHRRLHTLGLSVHDYRGLRLAEVNGFDLRRNLPELEKALDEVKPSLLVLDSWRSLWGGRENDSDEAAGVLDPLRNLAHRRGLAVILIHHMNRRGEGYRGNGAIGASVENILELARVDGDPDRFRRRLRNKGCRYAEEAPDRWLRLEADHRLGCLLIDEVEAPEAEEAEPRPVAPVREQLSPLIEAILRPEPQRLAHIATAVGRDPKDASVRRVLKALEVRGVAQQTNEGWCQVSGVAPPLGSGTVTPSENGRPS